MILKQNDRKLILINGIPDEDYFIQNNVNYIKVDSLPDSHYGLYMFDNDDNIVVDSEEELALSKQNKMNKIKKKFESLTENGVFESSLGFNIDNRRSGNKNDKDNIESLITLGMEPIQFKDADGMFHELSLSDLSVIQLEMIQNGLQRYQWKWYVQNQVSEATTIDDVESIIV